ncbi:hypothetical protein FJT64_010834 [Amphibalanus amphitrite]|uniref:Uncharacterized protein n=1 Tax=Amphibalanus amphitrite TaxID=1232801 RepID=A0A6A4VKG7_AMPAM|nr:hypothetical protein FJT64_010834 [Amphibalanus amphitrite]
MFGCWRTMLDYRSHDDEEETYLSCRDLSTDGGRDFRLGSVSSYASGDSMPQDLARKVSAKSPKNASADADDSDCDSDASGEYEPLREPSTSRLSVRSASPPPPLPPPRPRCNSFHARRPSTDSVSGKAGGHFGEPPQASQSLGDLSTVPAEPAPATRQTSFYRFLASHRPAAPKRLALLWRRKSDRTTRSDKAFDDPDVTAEQSVPNINQLTSPVYELIVKPPSIVVNCPEGGSLGQDHLARDCPQNQSQQEDDEGYMTMDAIHVILGSPAPPSPLLGAPDVSAPPAADLESCYLDMTGVERLRLAQAFDACRDSAEDKPPALPARPSLRGRSLRTAALRHASGDKIYYGNLDDFHLALQALQFESRPAIAEDE